MSTSGSSISALISAFTFGIVVNAASAALFLHASSHGSGIFRDGQRLALAIFFLSAALWAQVDFISIAINTTATGSCQVGVIFSTLFDQLGRFSIEQYLLWTINSVSKPGVQNVIPQIIVAVRFVLGAVFVGLSRPRFDPVCVPVSSVLALGIIVLALDTVIVAVLATRAFTSVPAAGVQPGQSDSGRTKAVLLVIASFAVWTAMSAVTLLGMQSTALLLRTMLPSIGLLVLVFIVAACNAQLTTEKPRAPRSPESPGVREANTSRSISTGGSSNYPPARFEDFKRNEILSVSAFERPREAPRPDGLNTTQRPAETRRQVFNFQQAAALAAGRIAISNPILQANGDQNPLNKIPTMSLEDAMKTEQERRADVLRRESALLALPAPQLSNFTPEEGLMRAVSLKRKTVASVTSEQMFHVRSTPSELMPAAATTSAQLSPGVEEIRRRSPRQSPTVQNTIQNIRPSRQLPERSGPAGATPGAESVKTPLQRRPTIGLPGNPRATAVKAPATDDRNQRQQTVLFINKIVYDDPDAVESVIQGANPKGFDARYSIVHRPRPIPRHLDEDRNIFPAEASPILAGHRRSKSGGSIGVRRSNLRYTSGGAPQVPPMPPPPLNMAAYKGGQNTNRPLPNDTKSMTFDEKMTLLFPTPPSVDSLPRRRSSLPEIPQIPYDFMPITMSPMGESSRVSGTTTKTGRTSIRAENILEVVELPPMDRLLVGEGPRRLSDEVGGSWLSGIDTGNIVIAMQRALEQSGSGSRRMTNTTNERRASSPVLPQIRDSALTASTGTQSHDDYTTNWGSVHSSAVAVPIQANRLVARSTYVKGESRDAAGKMLQTRTLPGDSPPLTDEEENGDAEPVQVKTDERRTSQQAQWHRRIGDDCPTFSGRKEKAWSRKMVPPTPLMLGAPSTKRPFIVKAAEPSPLESPEHALAQIQAQLRKFEEASMSVSGSPSQRFALLEDLEKEMDAQAGHWRTMQQDLGRDSMSSMQTFSTTAESRRQSMASNGDVMTPGNGISADRRASRRLRMQSAHLGVPPPITEENSSPTAVATEMSGANSWQRRLAEAQAEFTGSTTRLGGLRRSKNFLDMSELGSPTPPDSDDSDAELERYQPASIDQTIAAVAEAARKIAAVRQLLWTPVAAQAASTTPAAMLWTPAPKSLDDSAALFARSVSLTEQKPRSPSYRRKISENSDADLPLIETSALWSDEGAGREAKQSSAGLWAAKSSMATSAATATPALQPGPETEEGTANFEPDLDMQFVQQQKPPRPVTQRPPRRSRRITMLPDIIENPEPLPNKRDTLGIFQFPWGERSDMATFPPRTTTLMAMPGTMSSGGGPAISAALEARARQLESSEYSSSFFDDYDEEDELDKEVQGLDEDSDYSDSDDGFDENTLWEIASLLKTQQVPSKFSLLPPPLPPLEKDLGMDDYMSEIPSYEDEDVMGEEYDELKEAEIFVGMEHSIADIGREEVRASPLWRSNESQQLAGDKQIFGVAQPDEAAWKSYDSVSQAATARSKPRLSGPVTIQTSQLWEAPSTTEAAMAQMPSLLWASTAISKQSQSQPVETVGKLWTPLEENKGTMTASKSSKALLFDLEAAAASKMRTKVVRTTDKEPVSLNAPRAPRSPRHDALEPLTSSSLWTSSNKPLQLALLWTAMPKPAVKAVKGHLFDLDVATAQKLQSAVIRTTDKEPAALDAPRMPRTPKYASLEKLTSSSLWTAPSTAATKLWAPTMSKLVVKARGPLFDLDAVTAQKLQAAVIRTTDKEPAALNMPRKPRTVSRAPLEQLVSVSLWKPIGHGRINKALWAPKARVAIKAKGSLFDREASMAEKQNTHTRTTDKEPAALHMPRKVRKLNHAPLETFKSARLWQSSLNKKMLWAPKPVVAVVATEHLFDLAVSKAEKSRAYTRTTDKEPAALRMSRKARKATRAPLDKLSSSRLWQSSAATKSLWTPKPVAAVKAQGRQGHVLFDLAAAVAEKSRHAHTRTTDKEPAALRMPRRVRKASNAPLETLVSGSLWQSRKTIAHNTLWAPKPVIVVKTESRLFDLEASMAQRLQLVHTRTTEMEPVAAQVVRVPRSLAHFPVLPLTSTSLWSVKAAAKDSAEKSREVDWIMAKGPASVTSTSTSTSPASIRKQPLVTLSEDWDAALQEALSVSYPRKERISATTDQWWIAMLRAVAQSYPFDSARKHPALAGPAVDSSVILAHDVSKTHPVFFTGHVEEAKEAEVAEEAEEQTAQLEPWTAQYDENILAQVEALEHEREFAALVAQQQQQQQMPSFSSEPIREQQAAPEQLSEEDAQYYAYIQAMENDAMLRLQALEGAGVGVQLRY